MRTLKYKRPWRAKERIRESLKAGTLVSWWRGKDWTYVVVRLK